jgi:hypothetical protein
MWLPLRLAITDQEEEGGEEQAEDTAGVERQPWSVRLAGKLLQMVQQGDACPWKPYLAVSAAGPAAHRGNLLFQSAHIYSAPDRSCFVGCVRCLPFSLLSSHNLLPPRSLSGAASHRALTPHNLQLG